MYPAMKSLSLALLLAVAACENPSVLPSGAANGQTGEAGAAAGTDAEARAGVKSLDTRLEKVDSQLSKITNILEKEPAKVTGFNDARITRIEQRLDKVIKVLDEALPPPEPDPAATYAATLTPNDPSEGPTDAKVTIVEGYEFLCPFCYLANPTVEQIAAKYPKDVRIVAKYLIIHGQPAIMPGLMACAAAKQGKYSAFKQGIWSHFFKMGDNGRPQMQQDNINQQAIEGIAKDAGLDMDKLKTDTTSADCQGWLASSQELLHALGANATPAFFINGRFISGAQSFDKFDEIIKEELAKADKAIAGGVAQKDYYQKEVIEKGLPKVKGRFED